MRPVRVAFDAVPLLDTRTGVGRFLAEVVERLGVRPDLSLCGFGWPVGGRSALRTILPDGVRTAWLPSLGPPQRALWKRIPFPPIEMWTGRTDVVHGGNFVVPPTLRAAQLVTVHDLTVLRHPEMCTPDTLEFPDLLRRAIARGAWVHTVSHYVAEEVVELLDADPSKVVVVPNGVSAPEVVDRLSAGARGREVARSSRYVLALGTVEPRKDLPRLVAAFDLLAEDHPDLTLVLAGPDGWGSRELGAAIERSRHGGRVLRLGWVHEGDRTALLHGAALLAYPSRYEGFGLPPLEAMAAGTPVVTTAAGAIPEVVGDAAAVVPVGDVEALASAMDRVLSDPAEAAALVDRGSARVKEFSWDRTADGLAALYRDIAR